MTGILGDGNSQTAQLFWEMSGGKGLREHVFLMDGSGSARQAAASAKHMPNESYLIVNADAPAQVLQPFFEAIPRETALHLITYGYDERAGVTVSGVEDASVQVCIQRAFTTPGGGYCDAQEFKAPNPGGADPLHVLGAATACAVCDYSVFI